MLAGGGLIAVLMAAMVVLLAMTLGELRSSRDHIASTDARVTALLRRSRPTFEQVPTLADRAEPLLRRAAPLVGSLLAARPQVEDIGARLPPLFSGIQGLVNEGIPLAQELRASDLPGLAATINSSDLPSSLAALQGLIADLDSGGRLNAALDTTTAVLGDVQARDLPRRAEASSRRLRELLAVQRRTFSVLQRSLGVQRDTLGHVRSIDRKLGGQLPLPRNG